MNVTSTVAGVYQYLQLLSLPSLANKLTGLFQSWRRGITATPKHAQAIKVLLLESLYLNCNTDYCCGNNSRFSKVELHSMNTALKLNPSPPTATTQRLVVRSRAVFVYTCHS